MMKCDEMLQLKEANDARSDKHSISEITPTPTILPSSSFTHAMLMIKTTDLEKHTLNVDAAVQ